MKPLIFLPIVLLLASLLFTACKKEVNTPSIPCAAGSVEALIDCAGLPDEQEEIVIARDTAVMEFDFANNWICENITVDAAGATGSYRTFDPNSSVIWPGNLLSSKSLTKATPDEIAVDRAGGTFTINLLNNSPLTSKTVSAVTQANVIEAINGIISANSGVLAASFNYTERQVRSKQELALNLGVNVNTLTTDFSSEMSFSSDKEYNRFLVDFVQQYYTITYETPTSYAKVFAPSVTAEQLAPFVSEGNPPVFIKSVTYGRRFYLLIESTASARDMQASIRATYDAALVGGSVSGNVKKVDELEDVQIKVFAMGGDASLAAAAFRGNFTALTDFLVNGGNIETGAPMSYTMNALAPPNQLVGVRVATQFTVPNCRPVYSETPPAYTHAWYGVFGSEGIRGGCAIDPNQNNVLLISKDGKRYAQILGGQVQGIFGLDDLEGRLAGCPFEAISEAQVLLNGTIYVFDETGRNYATLNSSGAWSSIISLYYWGNDGQHPFLAPPVGAPGVGAALLYTGTVANSRCIHFNSEGTKWAIYNFSTGSFGTVRSLEDWGGNSSIPFPSVGSALHINDGGTYKQVLFNREGTKYTIYNGSTGFTDVYDLAKVD